MLATCGGGVLRDAAVAARYTAKVDRRGPDDCWPWTAATSSGGYGQFKINGKLVNAHRVGYLLLVGPIPDGMMVRHTCDNPPCQNPSHWVLGTHLDNMRDKVERGRQARVGGISLGKKNGRAVLTEAKVVGIREARRAGVPQNIVASAYEVSPTTIRDIERGKSWGWVP